MAPEYESFQPQRYERELTAIVGALDTLEELHPRAIESILRRYPKDGSGLFSKSEILRGFRFLNEKLEWGRDERPFVEALRMKPIRTLSGVAPVTVLTKPYPCPGRCIFCPSDVRMPKSYLTDEPGAQRAAQHQFDPYAQTLARLKTYHHNGHETDKIELIVLGGTWSYYPEEYQIWFIKRCLEAMNDFGPGRDAVIPFSEPAVDFRELEETVDGRAIDRNYNRIVTDFVEGRQVDPECALWPELERVQEVNETAHARCVGLSLETRPDHLSVDELVRLRRLGTTKVQIGYQSLSDEVLALNHRGHDVAATRRAMRLLRGAGFKIHAHWMPNLYGSSVPADREDFERIFADPDFRPDELKIYPCSLIESAELMAYHEDGRWQPYSHAELLAVLTHCMTATPEYCRLTRVIRDIPGTDIVAGNRQTNFREVAEGELAARGQESRDIRAREIREACTEGGYDLRRIEYQTCVGREIFLQYVTSEDLLAGFLRLSLPGAPVEIEEIADSAMIREVHVYGRLAALGERDSAKSQHSGLGRQLIEEAGRLAARAGFSDLAVISSIGTREYYRKLGFADGELYQRRAADGSSVP